jgi:fructokinase
LEASFISASHETRRAPEIVGLGELIWDLLPSGKQLGGAPTNFAYISRLLGNRSIVASRVGADELGREAFERLERLGISTSYLQRDALHPTGTVNVQIDERGEARFAVNENSAWDYLQWTADWEALAPQLDAVCFGTLGQRHQEARATMLRFLKQTRPDALRLFDVNLRHSFFTAEMLIESLRLATMVKLNSEELAMAARMLRLEEVKEEAVAQSLLRQFAIELVAVTRGAQGSLLVTERETVNHAGFQVQVADTIGAGDAFTATLAHCYLRRAPLKLASEAANRMGAWIATQAGATPAAGSQLPEQIFGDLELNA